MGLDYVNCEKTNLCGTRNQFTTLIGRKTAFFCDVSHVMMENSVRNIRNWSPHSRTKMCTYFRILGCLNGRWYICSNKRIDNTDIFLWSPSMRKALNLHMPRPPCHKAYVQVYVLGFGAHPTSPECMLIRIACSTNFDSIPCKLSSLRGCALHTMWSFPACLRWPHAFENGASHALAFR